MHVSENVNWNSLQTLFVKKDERQAVDVNLLKGK